MSPLEARGDINMVGCTQLTEATGDRTFESPAQHSVKLQCQNHDNDAVLPGCTLLNSLSMVSSGNPESDSVEPTRNCWSPTSIPPLLMGTDDPYAYPACTLLKSLSHARSIKKQHRGTRHAVGGPVERSPL